MVSFAVAVPPLPDGFVLPDEQAVAMSAMTISEAH